MAARARQSIVLAVGCASSGAGVRELCARLCWLLETSGAALALCDVRDVRSDAAAIDMLARLQLAARRLGREVRLRNASSDLLELLALAGLRDVLPE